MSFSSNESGAVTVDWVVLTAALVGLGLATMAVVSTGVQDAAEDTEAQLTSTVVTTTFRTTDGIAYGTFGAPILNPNKYENSTAALAGQSADDMRANYLTAQATLETDIAAEAWNKPTSAAYHDMIAIAEELAAQGEPLPDGALLANDAIQQVAAYNTFVAESL